MPRNTDDSNRRDDMHHQDPRGGRPMRDRMRDEEMSEEGMPPSRERRERAEGDMRERGHVGDRMRDEDAIPLDEDEDMRGEGYR